MKSEKKNTVPGPTATPGVSAASRYGEVLNSNIGESIDLLVEYLVDNNVKGIHPLIMGEVEKRLIVKVLERSRGNKVKAAQRLGMSRNTFHRKVQRLVESGTYPHEPES